MRNLIITASDKNYGDFLIEHWLRSLRFNVDLTGIDICVLDYGLTENQRGALVGAGVHLKKCKRDGHVVTLRFRDMIDVLKTGFYDQVLMVDSGDVIFQSDISHFFDQAKESMRARVEPHKGLLHLMGNPLIYKSESWELLQATLKYPMINIGVIFGPSSAFSKLADEVLWIIENKHLFGPDQIAVNMVLRRDGFVPLDKFANYIITLDNDFEIDDGLFYSDNVLIPIVHNTGGLKAFRGIEAFGYGRGYNLPKNQVIRSVKALHKVFG